MNYISLYVPTLFQYAISGDADMERSVIPRGIARSTWA